MPPGRKWGGVARRGAGQVRPEEDRRQPGRGRPPARRQPRKEAPELGPPPAWEPEEWTEEPDPATVRKEATRAVARGGKDTEAQPSRPRRRAPADASSET